MVPLALFWLSSRVSAIASPLLVFSLSQLQELKKTIELERKVNPLVNIRQALIKR